MVRNAPGTPLPRASDRSVREGWRKTSTSRQSTPTTKTTTEKYQSGPSTNSRNMTSTLRRLGARRAEALEIDVVVALDLFQGIRLDAHHPGGLHLGQPEVVVLAGPVRVDVAVRHRLEGALHADGADVDVPQRGSYEHDRDPAVDDVRQSHHFTPLPEHAEVQDQPGDRDGDAEQHHHPEPALLPTVVVARAGGMAIQQSA